MVVKIEQKWRPKWVCFCYSWHCRAEVRPWLRAAAAALAKNAFFCFCVFMHGTIDSCIANKLPPTAASKFAAVRPGAPASKHSPFVWHVTYYWLVTGHKILVDFKTQWVGRVNKALCCFYTFFNSEFEPENAKLVLESCSNALFLEERRSRRSVSVKTFKTPSWAQFYSFSISDACKMIALWFMFFHLFRPFCILGGACDMWSKTFESSHRHC